VRSFHAGVSAIVGHSPEDLLELARQQRDSGHILNARVLYAGVQGIIERGSDFQLGIVPLVQNEIQQFTPPPEFQGRPPFTWKMNDNEYRVGQVSILGIEGKLALVFALPEDNWNGNDDANRRNHAFIDAFVSTHPDYSLVFNFLIARAYKPDGSGGFATVYESNRGYH